MTEGTFKGWVPSDYFDECVPPGRPHPSDWLLPGDVMRLAAFDREDDATEPGRVLADGERVVFYSSTSYGFLTIDVASDGTFATEDAVPAGAKQFMVPFDPDSLSDSVADLARGIAECGDYGTYEVHAYAWCDGTVFELRAGRFVAVGAEGA